MDRSKQIVRVSLVGIGANVALAAFKALIGFVSGSIAVILDAVNNLSDALSSVITILGTKLAGRAPDKKHPYGYGRIEYITSIIIGVIVLLAGLTSLKESIDKIAHPEAASYTVVSLIVIAAAVAVKLLLGRYVKGAGERLNSEALIASGTDAGLDAVISFSTLVAALLSLLFHWTLEGWLGAAISVFIVKAGVEILLDSLNSIIGSRVEGELTTGIRECVCSFEGVRGAYDLILHRYGPEKVIGTVHIEVDDRMTAREIHALTRSITYKVYADFGVVLTVGLYAANTEDGEAASIRASVQEMLKEKPGIKQMHGFYVEEKTKTVSFDLVVEFGVDAPALREEVLKEVSARWPEYHIEVVLDSDFSD